MKKTFKLSIKGGIYFPLALLACCVPAAQVDAIQTDEKTVESEQAAAKESAEPKATDKTSEKADPEQKEAAEKAPKSIEEQIAQLNNELKGKTSEMVTAYHAAKTPAEQGEVLKSDPRPAYADKFLALYEANSDDNDAFPALTRALVVGGRRKASKPTQILREMADGQDEALVQKSCTALMQFGDSRSKLVAANKLFELGNKAAKEAEALRANAVQLLLPVADNPLRGKEDLHKEAVESLWALAKSNPEATDLTAFASVGFFGDAETSSAAFDMIMKHHLKHKDIGEVLSSVPRSATPAYEAILQEVVKNGEGDAKTQAAISLAQYIPVRDSELDRSQLSDEKLAALEKETNSLRELLGSFDGDSVLDKKAQKELFVLENLVIGVKAMDIVGTDLEGEEFKLSDYRGKIVFLDFWGDW